MRTPDPFKLVVFDLDGTLYEETHHFDRYAEEIAARLPDGSREAFWRDYRDAERGRHALRLGRAYDAQADLILAHRRGRVTGAWTWDGRALPADEVARRYPEPLRFDRETLMNIGDPWWLPIAVAVHYGLGPEPLAEAFLATRAFMQSEAFVMRPIPGLRDWIDRFRARGGKTALMTNSPEPDSRTILRKLGLEDAFDALIFWAEKPAKTEGHLLRLLAEFGVRPEEAVSVGDNWPNDIAPARRLGLYTVFVDPYGLGEADDADCIVPSLREALRRAEASGRR
ncbi:MAG: HAD family hydrolase [Hydrogenibacillus schlegelii]|uniref:HAD family hydrolase n=1 Tax=Hydrogenibacillus schlegelii TaxID=1484 RepID=A0A947GAD9_HYDSH|nr:HAD family hydrolase [Hydrogenibacillus schlegelii]